MGEFQLQGWPTGVYGCLRGVLEDTSGGVACLNTSVFYRGWIDDQMGGEWISCFPPFTAIFDRWALLPS